MEYTLDSVHLAKAALRKLYPDYQITSTEVLLVGDEMANMTQKDKRFFFGILTVSDARKVDLKHNQKQLIEVDPGTQIAGQLFMEAVFKDTTGALVDGNGDPIAPEGMFLGHEINVQSL